jgi:hypothetical protein
MDPHQIKTAAPRQEWETRSTSPLDYRNPNCRRASASGEQYRASSLWKKRAIVIRSPNLLALKLVKVKGARVWVQEDRTSGPGQSKAFVVPHHLFAGL